MKAVAIAAISLVPSLALAHAVVFPKASTPRSYEKYVLRVPNEKRVATTRIEIRFPSEVRVVSFADVAGWTLETVTDSAGRITGASWSGTLPPERFVELPFVAVNPESDSRLMWPAFQTYADGERVEWTGPEDSQNPASFTTISAAVGPKSWQGYVAAGALVLAFVSLGLSLRPRT